MTESVINRYQSAAGLPAAWDSLATSIFQQRWFLRHAEKYNPCKQRYYLLSDSKGYQAAACVYSLGINLFTFRNFPSRITMQVIGIPVSVSAPGIFGKTREGEEALVRFLFREEKGLILGLNLDPDSDYKSAIMMEMMPTVEFRSDHDGWHDYLGRMRSDYRRRTMRILSAFKEVREIRGSCSSFTDKHYSLYRQVIDHSTTKLETLDIEYFRNLPDPFYLTTYYCQDQVICWHICCCDGDTLYFFFGGHDYPMLNKYRSYFNNLFGIMREALEMDCRKIDFGQTAESAKLRLGGEIKPKRLFLFSRFPMLRLLIRLIKPFLTYRTPVEKYHLFRETQPGTKTIDHENPIRKTRTTEGNHRSSAYHDRGAFGVGSAGGAHIAR